MANTWNESGTTWSQGDWGNQNNYTLAISGVTFASDVGSVIGASEQGWGRDTYGNEPWGESNSPVVAISGFSFSANLGTLFNCEPAFLIAKT